MVIVVDVTERKKQSKGELEAVRDLVYGMFKDRGVQDSVAWCIDIYDGTKEAITINPSLEMCTVKDERYVGNAELFAQRAEDAVNRERALKNYVEYKVEVDLS